MKCLTNDGKIEWVSENHEASNKTHKWSQNLKFGGKQQKITRKMLQWESIF